MMEVTYGVMRVLSLVKKLTIDGHFRVKHTACCFHILMALQYSIRYISSQPIKNWFCAPYHRITSESIQGSRFNVQWSKFVVIVGKPLLLKIFQVLCLIIVGLATIVLLIVIFGYVGLLSPEQIESLEKLGTGVLNQKPSWAVAVGY